MVLCFCFASAFAQNQDVRVVPLWENGAPGAQGAQDRDSIAFDLAPTKAGVPGELHVLEKGPHGVGLDLQDPAEGAWPGLMANWLRSGGLPTR